MSFLFSVRVCCTMTFTNWCSFRSIGLHFIIYTVLHFVGSLINTYDDDDDDDDDDLQIPRQLLLIYSLLTAKFRYLQSRTTLLYFIRKTWWIYEYILAKLCRYMLGGPIIVRDTVYVVSSRMQLLTVRNHVWCINLILRPFPNLATAQGYPERTFMQMRWCGIITVAIMRKRRKRIKQTLFKCEQNFSSLI